MSLTSFNAFYITFTTLVSWHSGNWSTSDFFPVLLHLAASPQLCRLWWHAVETSLELVRSPVWQNQQGRGKVCYFYITAMQAHFCIP